MAEKITDNIFRLNIPLPKNPLKNLNSYLICGKDRNLLIDTGFRTVDCREAMNSELLSLSADLRKTDIFITHMHGDHIGLVPELAAEGARIYISSADAGFLNSLNLPETQAHLISSNVAEGYPSHEFMQFVGSAQSMVTSMPTDYTRLEDGDTLEYGGYTFNCILTPGHTPGHMCLYCAELKLMILGDHVLFGITPNIVRWPHVENALKAYLIHLQKIGQYQIEIPLPAHRSAEGTVTERIRAITEHHIVRLHEVYDIICAQPGLTAYDIAGRMHWDIRCDAWADFPPTQKWFAVGEALAHIDYLLADGDIVREDRDGVRHYHSK